MLRFKQIQGDSLLQLQVGPHRRNAVNKVAEIQIFQRLLYITPDFTRPIDIINVAGKYEKWYLCID